MKKLLFCLFFISVLFSVSAYDVDREELEKNKQEVEFINYTGIHEKIDTRQEIYSIGASLGQDIKGRQNSSLSGKYRVMHLVDPSEPDKLGADLFILEKNANVDHIRNLRLIISGYLKSSYGYSDSDASLLAEFVTYYNAVFRGKTDYFESKYNNMVLTNISSENAGIDVHYKNWPGRTRMLIPLKNGNTGEAPALSSGELSDEKVIEDLRTNEDKGISPRKEMVELREKELDSELEKAAEKEEKLTADKEKVSGEKSRVEEEIKGLEEKKAAGEIPDEEYKEEKARLEEKKEEIAAEENDLDKEIEKVKKETASIEEEKAEVAEERELIASDTNKLLENEEKADEKGSVTEGIRASGETFFIKVLEDSSGKYGELVLVDRRTAREVEKGSVKKAGIRGFLENRGTDVVITGSDNGSDFYLMKISNDNLEVKHKSEVAVYRDTVISEYSGKIFAVVSENSSYKIGRFSSELVLESVSDENVLPDTFIFYNDENRLLIFQNSSGDINAADSISLRLSEGE